MPKILIIDDNKDYLYSLKAIINTHKPDYQVVIAQSGEEGIRLANTEKPDTILLNMVIPPVDVFEVCRFLNQDDELQNTPLIILTTDKADSRDRIKRMKLTVEAVLSKPIDEEDLIAQMEVMLRVKKAEGELRLEKESLGGKVAEQTRILQESEERHRNLVELAPDGIATVDSKGIITSVNKALLQMSGYEEEEIVGKQFTQISGFRTQDISRLVKIFATIMKESIPKPIEIEWIHKDGSLIECEIHFTYTKIGKKVMGMLAVVRDVSKRKQVETALQESKTYAENILKSMIDALFVVAPDATIQTVNTAAITLSGYTEDELLGKPIGMIFDEGEEDVFAKQVLSTVEWKLQVIYDRDPEDFWSLLKKAHMGAVIIGPDGKIVMVNDETESIFGYDQGELIGKMIHELLPAKLRADHENKRVEFMASPGPRFMGKGRLLKARRKNGVTFELEVGLVPLQIDGDTHVVSVIRDPSSKERWEFIRHTRFGKLFAEEEIFWNMDRTLVAKNGGKIPVLMSGAVMRDDSDEFQRAVLVAKDITKHKRAEEEREQALREARHANKVKDLFLTNMSNEIRTPLNSLLAFSQLIEEHFKERIDGEVTEYFQNMRYSGERLMHTVHEILDISQMEAGTVPYNPRVIRLATPIESIIKKFRPKAEENNLGFSFDNQIEDGTVKIDEPSIVKAVSNLVENAIKYTEEGHIDISLYKQDGKYILSISDTGIGISPDYMDDLYGAFSQESIGYTREYQGLGLGLSIAKRYLVMNDVQIDVESKKDVGTTFLLIFTPADTVTE